MINNCPPPFQVTNVVAQRILIWSAKTTTESKKVASARDRKKYKRQRRKDVRRTRRRINDGEDAELTLFVCVICSVEVIELLAVFRSGIRGNY